MTGHRSAFDKLGAYRAVLQGRLQLAAGPRLSVKAQLLILASLISHADGTGFVDHAFAPSVADLCNWFELDERETRAALKTLAQHGFIEPRERPGATTAWIILFPFKGALERSPRRLPSPPTKGKAKAPPPTNGQEVDHQLPLANGQGGEASHPPADRLPPANRQPPPDQPPASGQVPVGHPLPTGQGSPPANGLGGQGGSLGSTQGSTYSLSQREDGSSLKEGARVAAAVPTPAPVVPLRPSSTTTTAPDAAQDPQRRAVARASLAPTDETAWRIWEALIRSPALRSAEDADCVPGPGRPQPGALARMAGGISGKLMSAGARSEVGVKVAQDVAREMDSEMTAAGNAWTPPTMARVSSLLGRYFGAAMRHRGTGGAPAAARAPTAARVPASTGAYGGAAAHRTTKGRLGEDGGAG